MSTSELHLVLGAGQIGPLVASRLAARGDRVRIARKSAGSSRIAGIETVQLDASDADAVARAAAGASVVYHCMNPAYDRWPDLLLPLTRGITDGVARAGAKLVALDNLYMYGDTAHLDETTPVRPVSKKGKLRAEAAEILLGSKGSVAIGRAADFFGPETPLTMLGEPFFSRVMAGKSAQVFGDPDLPRSYSYTPDVAEGLVALGSRPEATGVWMLPIQPAETTRRVVARFARALGREIAISPVPTWVLRAVGVFQPVVREIAEMTYQWKQPFVVDDAKFRAAFDVRPTPWDEAAARTVAWAEATYGRKAT